MVVAAAAAIVVILRRVTFVSAASDAFSALISATCYTSTYTSIRLL